MIKKSVSLSSKWPSENGNQLVVKIRNSFPEGQIMEKQYQERDSVFMMPTLILQSPYLELPVHFEFDGVQLSYMLFGINEEQLASHPKKAQILNWINEQVLKFQNLI